MFNKIFKLLFGDFMDTSDFFRVNAKDLLLQFPECLYIIYFTIQTSFIISGALPSKNYLVPTLIALLSSAKIEWQ